MTLGDGIATAASLAAMVALAYLFGWWGLVVGILLLEVGYVGGAR